MKIFINPKGNGLTVDDEHAVQGFKGCVNFTCAGFPLYYVVFADTVKKFVRTSVPGIHVKQYEKLVKEVFSAIRIGKYDSGYYGFEFTVPELTFTSQQVSYPSQGEHNVP